MNDRHLDGLARRLAINNTRRSLLLALAGVVIGEADIRTGPVTSVAAPRAEGICAHDQGTNGLHTSSLAICPIDPTHPSNCNEQPNSVGRASYISPTWGYQLSWDSFQWVQCGRSSEDRVDTLSLALWNRELSALLQGYEDYLGNPADCVAAIRVGCEQVGLGLRRSTLPLPKIGDDWTGAAYMAEGFVVYRGCRSLTEKGGMLSISAAFEGDVAGYLRNLSTLEALVAKFNLPPIRTSRATPSSGERAK